MAVFNTFTFDGENSLDYGVYITGEAVYNAPERAVEMVSIPGKNGALALDQGRFENIEVTYPAGTFGVEQAEFAGRMRAFRNMLASRYNYVRLTDSYHPDEFRLGLYKSGLEASPAAMSSAGEFDITFNCKPQRFLTSGEEPVDTGELGGEVTTDTEPYLFRRSGGGNIGHDFDAEIDKIIGGTVAWNQLVQNGNFADTSNWAAYGGTLSVANNEGTFTFGASPATSNRLQNNISLTSGHKFLFYAQVTLSRANALGIQLYGNTEQFIFNENVSANTPTTIARVFSTSEAKSILRLYFNFSNTAIEGDTTKFKDVFCIDLTSLFGSAEIADYVYSLEQTTAGAGVAWLRNHGFIDGSYRAYDSGSLQSVKTSEHRTVGFNQWDEEWESGYYDITTGAKISASNRIRSKNKIKVVPSTAYYVTRPASALVFYYDADENYLGYESVGVTNLITTPSNCAYMTFSCGSSSNPQTSYNNDICINISDPSKNGQYEPYESHSYPLDSDLELRGKFKLDANNNLYADGDVYENSGVVSREWGYIVFDGSSDENWGWSVQGADRNRVTFDLTTGTGAYSTNVFGNYLVAPKVVTSTPAPWEVNINNNGGLLIGVPTTITSASDWKTYLSTRPLTVVYELVTPTTEQADPYANPQVVNPLGTEEYIDTRDVPVPVGHETKYGMSQLVLTNPTEFPSKPLLEVTGVGTFWLGDTLFTITGTAGQTIYIDCETGEAWKNTGGIITPANGLVTLNRLDFPELDPGDTPVMYGTGITKVVVTPRWWII